MHYILYILVNLMHPKLIQKNSYSKLLNGIVSQLKKQQQKTNKQSSTTVFITDNN